MSIGIVSQLSSSARRATRIAKAAFVPRVDTANPKPGVLGARSRREAALVEHIRDVHSESCSVYGVRNMWCALRCQGIDIGRE